MSIINKGPSIFVANNDDEAISIINKLSGNNYTTISDALQWVAQNDDIYIQNKLQEDIVTDGLVLYLDASNIESYPKGGTTWYDLSGNGNNGTLVNGVSFNDDVFIFDGINDKINLLYSQSFNIRTAITLSVFFKRNSVFNQMSDCFILSRPPSWYFYDSYNSGSIRGDVFIDGVRRGGIDVPVPFDGNWYKIDYTYDSVTHESCMYKNGELYGSIQLSGLSNYLIDESVVNFANPMFSNIGKSYLVSILSVYNRALSSDEVLQNYNVTKTKYKIVFGYDQGDINSYLGEPTTNIVPHTDYSDKNYNIKYNISGWGGDSADIYYSPNDGYNNLPYKKMTKITGGSGGSFINDYTGIIIEDNKTYNISCYMKASYNVTLNGYCLDLNRIADNAYRVNNTSFNITTEWVRYSWVYNSIIGQSGLYHSRGIIYVDNNLPLDVYWCGFQVEEKSHATPFVSGTRSATQSLLDITGNNIIDLSQVSFNSNAIMVFDGVDDFIRIPYSSTDLDGDPIFSVESVIKRTNDFNGGSYWGLGGDNTNVGISTWTNVANKISIDLWGTATFHTNIDYPLNEYVHVVWVKKSTIFNVNTISIFINGIEYTGENLVVIRGTSHTPNLNTSTEGKGITIGRGGPNTNLYYAPGEVHLFKVYNSALSNQEVKYNFDTIKNRFGL